MVSIDGTNATLCSTSANLASTGTRTITLNHDGGRWLSLGLPGELPAVVRQVNGQWQRQP